MNSRTSFLLMILGTVVGLNVVQYLLPPKVEYRVKTVTKVVEKEVIVEKVVTTAAGTSSANSVSQTTVTSPDGTTTTTLVIDKPSSSFNLGIDYSKIKESSKESTEEVEIVKNVITKDYSVGVATNHNREIAVFVQRRILGDFWIYLSVHPNMLNLWDTSYFIGVSYEF